LIDHPEQAKRAEGFPLINESPFDSAPLVLRSGRGYFEVRLVFSQIHFKGLAVNSHWRKSFASFLFLGIFSLGAINPCASAAFIGDAKTGLLELADSKVPVSIFVPTTYTPSKQYPLLILIPAHNFSLQDQIKEWSSIAKQKSYILLAPDIRIRDNDVPYRVDEWLLGLKKNISDRYHINPRKIFLVGEAEGATYAGYLGLKYPHAFSAVGLTGGSWVGAFEQMTQTSSRARKQVPFFVALPQGETRLLQSTESKAYQLTKKGYPIYFEKVSDKKEFRSPDYKKRMITWLEEKSQTWTQVIQDKEKSFKEKVAMTVEDFFVVR
jgi:hypothetical protein